MNFSARDRRRLAPMIYDVAREMAIPIGAQPIDVARRVVAWLPTLELPAHDITYDIMRALAGVPHDGRDIDAKLLGAACKARDPALEGVFVYAPGRSVKGIDGAFSDWNRLMGALEAHRAAMGPGERTIEFDDTLAPIAIPPGTHDMKDVRWASAANAKTQPQVNIGPGVRLQGLRKIASVSLNSTATNGPAITPPAVQPKQKRRLPNRRRRGR